MSEEPSRRRDDVPSGAGAEAMRAWESPGIPEAMRDSRTRTTAGGHMIVQAPRPTAARGIEETVRAHEEMHSEGREALMLAVGEALARGAAAGPGPWAIGNCATEKGREDLRRAGFEERHDGEGKPVWVRTSDEEALEPREAGFVVPVEVYLGTWGPRHRGGGPRGEAGGDDRRRGGRG